MPIFRDRPELFKRSEHKNPVNAVFPDVLCFERLGTVPENRQQFPCVFSRQN